MMRLKFAITLSPPTNINRLPPDSPVTFAPMEAIQDGLGGLDTSKTAPLAELKAGSYNLFSNGDVLLAKVTPCFENGKKCLAHDLTGGIGYATSEVHVMRPKQEKISPRFLMYLLSSDQFRTEGIISMTGSGGLKRVSAEAVLNHRIVIEDVAKQSVIADYLDGETRRIDELIKKKTRFIALLREKRAAVIDHAVTKGIDRTVEMKPSGVDWLGDIPVHWETIPPNVLFKESKERAHEGDQLMSATQKYGVIPLADFEALEQRQVTMAQTNLDKRKHVEVGDFVISMRSMDGGLERARGVGSVRSSYSVLKSGPEVDGRFFGYLLKSSLYIQALRLTTSFIRDGQDMNFSHFKKVRLPRIPMAEQSRIADNIEHETDRIDDLLEKTERSIALLKEKRAALITAAVTGKIDVKAAA